MSGLGVDYEWEEANPSTGGLLSGVGRVALPVNGRPPVTVANWADGSKDVLLYSTLLARLRNWTEKSCVTIPLSSSDGENGFNR